MDQQELLLFWEKPSEPAPLSVAPAPVADETESENQLPLVEIPLAALATEADQIESGNDAVEEPAMGASDDNISLFPDLQPVMHDPDESELPPEPLAPESVADPIIPESDPPPEALPLPSPSSEADSIESETNEPEAPPIPAPAQRIAGDKGAPKLNFAMRIKSAPPIPNSATAPWNSALPIHHPQSPIPSALVVSIHDVSANTRLAVERILADLESIGVNACSLLVIPDHHRRGHMLDDSEFCEWLKNRVTKGDEAVIHGYFHSRDRQPGESLREKFTTQLYTKDEGEFFDIAGADALRIVNQARNEFRQLGLEPRGFVAPAWLLSQLGQVALRVLGITYTTRLTTVEDLAIGAVPYRSQSLVWSVRSAWRRVVSLGWNAFLFRRLRTNPLLRIGIHPTDIEHPIVWRQILNLTRRALVERTPVTYLQWVETRRSSKHGFQS